MSPDPAPVGRPRVHGARVVYCENPAFLAQLRQFAAAQGLTLSEVQRQATRRMVAGA